MKQLITKNKQLRRFAKLFGRWWRAHANGYPDWRALLHSDYSQFLQGQSQNNGPEVLIATSVGAYLPGATLESLIGAALSVRGAKVHMLLCDAVLPACFDCEISVFPYPKRLARHGPQRDLCQQCFPPAAAMFQSLGLVLHRYSDLVTPSERGTARDLARSTPSASVADFHLDGLAVGEHALAGALRFFARADLSGEPEGDAILRRYFEAALLTLYATRRLFGRHQFQAAVFHHGIYVPQGLIGEVARQAGVRVVNWNPAYRKKCFVFSEGDTYHHTLMSEPVAKWDQILWGPDIEEQTLEYLKSRWSGSQDWIWFHERPQIDVSAIAAEVGIDFKKPTIGLLTNVMWDAQLHYPANAFPNMLDWLLRTITYFRSRADLQLLIRIHPAELRGGIVSRQPVLAEIRKAFADLPPNVYVVPPESHVSTYAAMLQCDTVVIYGTKTGVELTSLGIPVIVAGEAWIRNKGITTDATSAAEYFALLDQLPVGERLDEATVLRARKYAFHFFFRRMIPIDCMEVTSGWPPYRIRLQNAGELAPGHDPGLDVICDGILRGTDFIYRAERFVRRAATEGAGNPAGAGR